jgi:hypothetical protein
MSGFPSAGCKSTHLSAAGSTAITAGIFFGLTVNTGAAGATVTLYDGIDNTGTIIGVYSAAAVSELLAPMVGCALTKGLYAVVTGTPDITLYYF